jgi:hypothetical protein
MKCFISIDLYSFIHSFIYCREVRSMMTIVVVHYRILNMFRTHLTTNVDYVCCQAPSVDIECIDQSKSNDFSLCLIVICMTDSVFHDVDCYVFE